MHSLKYTFTNARYSTVVVTSLFSYYATRNVFCVVQSVLQQLQPSSIPFLDNINIPRWNGCRDKVRRNVRNAELQMKSCIIQVKEEKGKKRGKLIILLMTKRRLEIMLNCHSGLLSANSLGCFHCCQSCHEPENNDITLTPLSPLPHHPSLCFLQQDQSIVSSHTRQLDWWTRETLLLLVDQDCDVWMRWTQLNRSNNYTIFKTICITEKVWEPLHQWDEHTSKV